MKLTSLAFLEIVEETARKVLPGVPFAGAEWRFERFLAFHSQSGSLQVLAHAGGRESQLLGVMHVRELRDDTGSFLRGWVQTEKMAQPEPFVLHVEANTDVHAATRTIVSGWAEQLMRVLSRPPAAIEPPASEELPQAQEQTPDEGSALP